MPSRKQRRRRAKAFRHEYDLVLVDAEGNEMPLDPEERRVEREAKDRQRAAQAKPARGKAARGARIPREPPQPSWDRALRRGGLMGALMLLAFVFLFKSQSLPQRLGFGAFYAVAFVPLTYFVDRTAYRTYLRRLERAGGKKG
jgi:hypothetical protein